MAAEVGWSNRALLAAGLVWLVLLVFPLVQLIRAATDPSTPARTVPVGAVGLAVLLVCYTAAVTRVARTGPQRPVPVATTLVAVVTVALPLLAGPAWIGGTVFVAVLLGLTLPRSGALVGVAGATVLAVVTGVLSRAPAATAVSVPLVTVLAGVASVAVVRQYTLGRELAAARAERERLRLARTLHDSVKQQAFVAALELGTARRRAAERGQPDDEHLAAAAAAVVGIQRGLVELIDGLRPETPTELHTALRDEAAAWSRRHGIAVRLRLDAAGPLPAEPLLPAAIEAWTNIARHAPTTRRVTVQLREVGDMVRLTVSDDGPGFDTTLVPRGHGLRGAAERLAEHGGSLRIDSRPGAGTTLTAEVPHR